MLEKHWGYKVTLSRQSKGSYVKEEACMRVKDEFKEVEYEV